MSIFATLKRTFSVYDGSTPKTAPSEVGPGRIELERIPNPLGYEGSWLVLKGTKTGMAEGAWRQWINGVTVNDPGHPDHGKPADWGDWEIIVEEDGKILPSPQEQ